MFYVYVLQSQKDGKWYTGATNDLKKRLKEHNEGRVLATKDRRPLELIYYETSINQQDGFAREKYLKTGMGKRYIRNRLRRFFAGNIL